MRHALGVILLLVFGSAQASTVTVDFEEFNIGDSAGGLVELPPLQSQGYNVSGFVALEPGEILIGTNTGTKSFGGTESALGQDSFGVVVQVLFERSDGSEFAINSLDLLLESDPSGSTSITGTLAGGGSANLGVPVGTGDWLSLESVVFRAEGNGFGFGFATVEIDNINVSAVPVPAAVWLFGSALAGLGWMRRKQTV